MTNWFQTSGVSPIYGWGLSKRWIVQGGPVVNDECTMHNAQCTMHNAQLVERARKAGCVYVEIRCYDDYSAYRQQLEQAGFTYVPHYDVTIDPAKPVPYAKMRQIRKAEEEGYSWRETTDEKDIRQWYKLLRRLYWYKIHRPLPCLQWFREMIYDKGCRLLVVHNAQCTMHGGIVGGVLLAVEDDKSKAYEWYICGQVMSTWAAIDYCRREGIQCFDTMGAGVPDVPYGVRDFKLQMGGELHEWGRYISILRPRLYQIGKWLMQILA